MSDLRADLDAYVAGDDEDAPDEPPPVPEDAAGANRLLRRVRHYERDLEQVKAVAVDELRRIQAWYDDRASGLRASIAYVERSLEQWMRSHHDATGAVTSKLPNGELRVRPGRARLVVLDQEKAVAAAQAWDRSGWVRVKEEIAADVARPQVFAGPALQPEEWPKNLERVEGAEWCEAWTIAGFDSRPPFGFAVPWVARVPHVAVLEWHQRTFGYTTIKEQEQGDD